MTTAAGRQLTVGEVREALAGLPDDASFTVNDQPIMDLEGANVVTDTEAIIQRLGDALQDIATGNHLKREMIELAKKALS